MGLILLIGLYIFTKTRSLELLGLWAGVSLSFFFLILMIHKKWKEERLAKSGIWEIDRMDGREFEKYLAVLFKKNGYKTQITRASNDYGADLVIEKDNVRTVVQAKRYSKKVGIKAVQEIVSAKNFYSAHRCMVITNNYFTDSAINLAKSNNVKLIDRDKLVAMLLTLNSNNSSTSSTKTNQ